MPRVVHLVRHAQGVHNLNHDRSILDPQLSEQGIAQAQALCRDFPYKDRVGLVVVSPLRRTLHTALEGMRDVVDRRYYVPDGAEQEQPGGVLPSAEMLLEPDLQAHSDRPCDTGSPFSVVKAEFPQLSFVDVNLAEDWNAKQGIYAGDEATVDERIRRVRTKLIKWFEKLETEGHGKTDIVLVTHGGILDRLLGSKRGEARIPESKWKTFEVTEKDGEAVFVET
ncbi:histidine phosphatase superfamily [Xylariales sp. PMI_506]|nr:histidine phosphatase superfamily [Xylariales sp. PMI_506]